MKNTDKILLHQLKRQKKNGILERNLYVEEHNTGLGPESGVTSETADHRHIFFVDSSGNGWAKDSMSKQEGSQDITVAHSHKIVNWVIQPGSDEKRSKHLHHLPFNLIQRRIISLSDKRVTKEKCLQSHSSGGIPQGISVNESVKTK